MNRTLYNNFIDFEQAFDSAWQDGLWRVMKHCRVLAELVVLIEDIYGKSRSAVRVERELTDWFLIKVGVRQGYGMSADLFNLILEIVMRLAERREEVGVMINGTTLNYLRFVDDIDLIADTETNLQQLTDRVHGSSKRMGMRINTENTKTMTIGKQHEDIQIKLGGEVLEQVTKFVYLGETLKKDGRSTEDNKKKNWAGMCSLWETR